jgi:hypothetical protein
VITEKAMRSGLKSILVGYGISNLNKMRKALREVSGEMLLKKFLRIYYF